VCTSKLEIGEQSRRVGAASEDRRRIRSSSAMTWWQSPSPGGGAVRSARGTRTANEGLFWKPTGCFM
jgi:hypothetical protein